jgi:hypothetical protein
VCCTKQLNIESAVETAEAPILRKIGDKWIQTKRKLEVASIDVILTIQVYKLLSLLQNLLLWLEVRQSINRELIWIIKPVIDHYLDYWFKENNYLVVEPSTHFQQPI